MQVRCLGLSAVELGAIAERLRGFHKTRQHPAGQSLRYGTQTRGRLFERNDEQVGLLRAAIRRVVDAFWQQLPPYDASHPVLRHRGLSPEFAGSWSVRLTSGGFHVPHIHPRGIYSSAYYIALPEISEYSQEGWLELGRPPPDLGLDCGPVKSIRPQVGHLALFPSTLYHNTVPFQSGERLSVAFDLTIEKT
jgi:hypothetical protein